MTEPVWDGTGIDPWLPARLAADVEITDAEHAVYQQYWAALSSWLVAVHRAVLRGGGRPDATAVYSTAPAWAQAMADFTGGVIRQVMGRAYETLLGRDYRYDSRPAVASHLADVLNRMVRTTDEVFDLVAGQISLGAGLGESIPELAERVDGVLSATGTERWPNRAVVVARTETIGALNAGRADAFTAVAEDLGDADGPWEQMWLATTDSRTRRSHRDADGQRVPVGTPFQVGSAELRYPGDPRGPAKEVIQCRCTTLLVRADEEPDMTRRQFAD